MKNQNIEKNCEESLLKSKYLKLTGTSGTDYYLVKIIGRGTFGVVYEAYGSKRDQNNSMNTTHNGNMNYSFEENKEDSNNEKNNINFNEKYAIKRYSKASIQIVVKLN